MDEENLNHYNLDKGWRVIFKEMNISSEEVLRHAQLPRDLLIQKSPTISATQYFQFWEGLKKVAETDSSFILRLVQAINAETLSPALFACLSSHDLNAALHRISYYKPIEGPIRLAIHQSETFTSVSFYSAVKSRPLPTFLAGFELAFWVRLARLATREDIIPLKVETNIELANQSEYETFFKIKIIHGESLKLTFSASDARLPFLTSNEAMWTIFEPALNKRMRDLDLNAPFTQRVQACLTELLPGGKCSIDSVAEKLGLSARTLQRRLNQEGTVFQNILNELRKSISINYLAHSNYSNIEIGFLIGFDETNSFFRAFKSWTGKTPEEYRTLTALKFKSIN